MMRTTLSVRLLTTGTALTLLGACDTLGGLDFDLRGGAGAFDTSEAALAATVAAPAPDARGIVSYPGYQVALAQSGDTVNDVARRVGLPAEELAAYNALPENVALRPGEVVALPRRVEEPVGAPGGEVTDMAAAAIARAEAEPQPGLPAGDQPVRHQVQPGETAFSIARRYNVPVSALADWNGLGTDLNLRTGQFLLIPTRENAVEVATLDPVSAPGTGSVAPLPPSAAQPLPDDDAGPIETVAVTPPPEVAPQTAASDTSRLRQPVPGRIIRPFGANGVEGIGIAAAAGTSVVAADAGTVAAITQDTDGVPIMVLRHADNLLTVYAGVDDIAVAKGDRVTRGQKIAEVRSGDPSFLHFEVREGFDSVDPVPFLN